MHSQAYWPAPEPREVPRPATNCWLEGPETSGSKPSAQIVDDLGIRTKVAVQEGRDGRPRQVISGRSESTGQDDQVGHIKRRGKCGLNRLGVIPYYPPPNDRRTEDRQLSTQPRPVGVCRLAGEKLLTDGDYGSVNPLVSGHTRSVPEAQQGTVRP